MFSLKEHLIKIAQANGSQVGYDEKQVTDNLQRVYEATQTPWGKRLPIRDILFSLRISL